jgi:hypothetical protein
MHSADATLEDNAMIKLSDLFQLVTRNKEKALTMSELKRKIDASGVDFPIELPGKTEDYPERTVIPRPVRVGDESIAGLFLFCPDEDMEYFKIKIPPPEPGFKFRFLEYELFSVIEVLLLFKRGRQIVLHLNPSATSVQDFLGTCGKTGILSFHYVCATSGALVSCFTDVDGQHLEWIKRNHLRSLQLETIPDRIFSIASTTIAKGFMSNQRYYGFADGVRRKRKKKPPLQSRPQKTS